VKSPEERLRYYASQFPIVENDSGYWALPERQTVEAWSQRTPADFVMSMKAHALLTGHYTHPRRLPQKIRERLPSTLLARERVYPRHLDADLLEDITARFYDALAPLHESGKLGVVLFQFPVWFPISRDHKKELLRIRRRFSPYRVAVEFRNATWMSENNRDETLDFLTACGLAYVCVDEPQGFVSSVPPISAATSDVAVVRLHGRNAARWSRGARSAAERFDYLYSPEELRQWVPRIVGLAEETKEVHVLLNNCHSDYAVRNARTVADLVEQAQAPLAQPAPAPAG
jgi:uncharacterized protein YecE (DUF72 family)